MSDFIKLPDPLKGSDVSLKTAILRRRSRRHFLSTPLSAAQVSQILWAAYGFKDPHEIKQSSRGVRTCPSAGALYPLEIYLVAGNVEGSAPGLYRYMPKDHALQKLAGEDLRTDLVRACRDQGMLLEAPATLVYSIKYSRISARYGDRGVYRYVPMDIGHSAQNVYLMAEAMGLGTCAVGAFDDSLVREVIGLPDEEHPLYLLPLGVPVPAGSR